MKAKLILTALVLAASSAFGTVTLQFNTATGSLQNFANGAGAGGTAMVWGLIIDAGGDGFDYNQAETLYAHTGVTYTGASLQSLNLLVNGAAAGASDDVLFLAPNLMNVQGAVADGMPAGTNRVTSIAAVPFGTSDIGAGDAFAVVWFDRALAADGSAVGEGTKFGAVNHAGFVIPPDGATTSFAELFAGPDALKTQNFTIGVPEPSGVLLGLLGAVGLLRRRR